MKECDIGGAVPYPMWAVSHSPVVKLMIKYKTQTVICKSVMFGWPTSRAEFKVKSEFDNF